LSEGVRTRTTIAVSGNSICVCVPVADSKNHAIASRSCSQASSSGIYTNSDVTSPTTRPRTLDSEISIKAVRDAVGASNVGFASCSCFRSNGTFAGDGFSIHSSGSISDADGHVRVCDSWGVDGPEHVRALPSPSDVDFTAK
jgi:hypothetical protein